MATCGSGFSDFELVSSYGETNPTASCPSSKNLLSCGVKALPYPTNG